MWSPTLIVLVQCLLLAQGLESDQESTVEGEENETSVYQGITDKLDDGVNLVDYLLARYPQHPVRPVRNQSNIVEVMHRMTPIQLIDMDEKNQVITLKSWLAQRWKDEYLTWDPANFSGISEMQIPIGSIWQPDTVIYSSVRQESLRQTNSEAIVTYDGTVLSIQFYIIKATCAIDATLFPFDEQRCDFKFASWSYHGGLVNFVPDPKSDVEHFISNGEWELLEMPVHRGKEEHVCCKEPFPGVNYTLHLKRRSTFYVVNIVFPSFLAYILISVGFYMPSDSGERMSLCVISILSQFVFLTVVADFMPPTAEFVPYLQRYFFTTIGLAVVSAFVTAWTLNMHFQGAICHEVPQWIKCLCFEVLARFACTRVRVKKYKILRSERVLACDDIPMTLYNSQNKTNHRGVNCENQIRSNDLDKNRAGSEQEDGALLVRDPDTDPEIQQRRLREWREVARIIDRSYFVLYTLMQIFLVIGFLAYIAKTGEGFHQEDEDH
ncbi:neuronal acetylcholine receptor subunit alpha-9-like isoform X2 [Ptychodera flava]|uniref:neuronal acetylcholine receptor subunit alpha-9-like isoform X2 n=1 Tax=Ptychodera flava TaxID=63121 RepID=UPI003969F1FC